MTDTIDPSTIARLRELLDAATSGGRGWRAVMRGDEWRIRAPHPAASSCEPSLDCENNVKAIVEVFNAIHPLIDQLAAWAAEIEGIKRDRDNIRYALEDYGKHINRAQSILSPRGLGKNYLHAALDQLEEAEASVAELERELAEARKPTVSAVTAYDAGQRDAEIRIKELEELLEDALRDGFDVFVMKRARAVLSKREGGR